MTKIGIIGGSGLDDPKILKNAKEKIVATPYGDPTSPLTIGAIEGVEVVMLARHGRQHTIPPTQVNYRAKIYALKEQNCTHILDIRLRILAGRYPARRLCGTGSVY